MWIIAIFLLISTAQADSLDDDWNTCAVHTQQRQRIGNKNDPNQSTHHLSARSFDNGFEYCAAKQDAWIARQFTEKTTGTTH